MAERTVAVPLGLRGVPGGVLKDYDRDIELLIASILTWSTKEDIDAWLENHLYPLLDEMYNAGVIYGRTNG
jgi:hypothetical protein